MPRKIVVLALVALVVVGACGGGGSGDDTTTVAGDQTPTTSPTASTATSVDGGDGSAPELAGTTWTVTHYFSLESDSTTNPWPDTEITINFDSETELSGNAGCNDFFGTYRVEGPYVTDPGLDEEEGQAIEITDLGWTEMACEGDNVMTQEAEFLEVLPQAARWSIGAAFGEGDGLLIRSDDVLILEATPTS